MGVRRLNCESFYFSILTALLHNLLAYSVAVEKNDAILFIIPLYVTFLFLKMLRSNLYYQWFEISQCYALVRIYFYLIFLLHLIISNLNSCLSSCNSSCVL